MEIHGGAWNDNDRSQNRGYITALASSGIVVAAFDYRGGHEAPYPSSLQDINLATRWLKAHAREYGGSTERLGAIGSSSGGHLVMLAAMRPRDPRYTAHPLPEAPDVDATLSYAITSSAVIDPLARYRMAQEQGRAELLANHLRFYGDEETMAEANPQMILERGEAVELPRALFVQGAADGGLTPRMAENFVFEYAKAGGVIELLKFQGQGHVFIRQPGPATNEALEMIKGFIARQLVAPAADLSHHWR
jgi:acetyl esterase/lipase